MPEIDIKAKPVSYEPIPEKDEAGNPTRWYAEMQRLIDAFHPTLSELNIKLTWKKAWKPDKDGKLILGQARKCSEPERQLHKYQCMILLNHEWYHDPSIDDQKKIAVLDHELCHFELERDKAGEPRKDENGDAVPRMVRHDLEEFRQIVERYGLYTENLQRMAGAIYNARVRDNGATQVQQPEENDEAEVED